LQDDITSLYADALSALIHRREISCREVMAAYLNRINKINPIYNAIVNIADEDLLLDQADTCDVELQNGQSRGWLHGIPQAIKDAASSSGFPTTLGSPLLQDAMAKTDTLMVSRMKATGCIVIGKTNMPELGLGSNTFNEVFGATRNAWDTDVSAGGSSGGTAVALSQRMLPVADGSDFMGSLRNPAAWNHVFGMRPSQGRIPLGPGNDVFLSQLVTEGPMARNVKDLSKLLEIQSGFDPRLPLSLSSQFHARDSQTKAEDLKGLRIGWLGDLSGHLATEGGILEICEKALHRMASAGAIVTPMALGFDTNKLWECWLSWRRALVGPRVTALMGFANAREHIKPEALWEFDHAQGMSYTQFSQASQTRTSFYHHMLQLFQTQVDVIAMPVVQTWPFAIEKRWPTHIGNRKMDTYHRWMESTIYATLAGLPAISVPAGFHPKHTWPMGLQLIGPPQGDSFLLKVAAAYEDTSLELMNKTPTNDILKSK
jgi:amidase